MSPDAPVEQGVRDLIDTIIQELEAIPDAKLGGPAAPAARLNARVVADYLRGLGEEALPRHAGKASAGKVAQAISAGGRRFNRQNFATNDWCARLLATYDEWERTAGTTRLAAARAAAEEQEPSNRRISDLESELLLLRAENQRLRQEVGFLRGFVAETGRMP
ncbi:hypothetical protein [Sphingomonas mollis]|uniref:KfrA N-terminal DNA-binding domain-containing protein n=1 Tax=Sphingomonas mollis TaxID=2795726 RepID=A0ABS0XRU1_9SPHN|nr:hypothetical protein [Sphingomonas sp. BT553]MBJ6122505.1 hypothetical protein [Sphingomonas sp. BT553]